MNILALDIGTSRVKAAIWNSETGMRHTAASRTYATSRPESTWAEQDPRDWLNGVEEATRAVLAAAGEPAIAAMGFTGQMHALVLTDRRLRPLRPAMTWADQRSTEEAEALGKRFGDNELRSLTGSWASPDYIASKLFWVRRHEPHVLKDSGWVLMAKDWVRAVLGGTVATDPTDASGSGLFDVTRLTWLEPLVDFLGLDATTLPSVLPSAAVAGGLSEPWASRLGVRVGTPLVVGGGDLPAATLASGIGPGHGLHVNIGSAGQVALVSDATSQPATAHEQVFCHPNPSAHIHFSALLAAGLAVAWAKAITRHEGRLPPSDRVPGSVFVPYLQGQRHPGGRVEPGGALLGIGMETDAETVVAGVAYGVACAFREQAEALAGGIPGPVVLTAEAAYARDWAERLANVMGCAVSVLNSPSPSAYGAVRMSLVALGASDWSDAREMTTYDVILPADGAVNLAQRLYGAYRRAADAVATANSPAS